MKRLRKVFEGISQQLRVVIVAGTILLTSFHIVSDWGDCSASVLCKVSEGISRNSNIPVIFSFSTEAISGMDLCCELNHLSHQ
jgi:hypothetical protein